LGKTLIQMKFILQGTPGTGTYFYRSHYRLTILMITQEAEFESNPQQVYQLVSSIINEDLLFVLATNLHRLSFEARKDAQTVFSHTLRFNPAEAVAATDPIALSYVINKRPEVLVALCNGYNHKECAMAVGTILRDVLKNDAATAIILYDDSGDGATSRGLNSIKPELPQSGKGVFWKFFDWIDKGSFEVGADAFTTFRVGGIVPLWLEHHLTPTGTIDQA
jgi:calcium binding protein 39